MRDDLAIRLALSFARGGVCTLEQLAALNGPGWSASVSSYVDHSDDEPIEKILQRLVCAARRGVAIRIVEAMPLKLPRSWLATSSLSSTVSSMSVTTSDWESQAWIPEGALEALRASICATTEQWFDYLETQPELGERLASGLSSGPSWKE